MPKSANANEETTELDCHPYAISLRPQVLNVSGTVISGVTSDTNLVSTAVVELRSARRCLLRATALAGDIEGLKPD